MTSQHEHTLIGASAGYSINSAGAQGTTAVGLLSLYNLTDGAGNVAVGYETLLTEDTGEFNTAIGYQALRPQNRDGTVGNTALGYKAGYAVTNGYENVYIGYNAAIAATTGFSRFRILKLYF